MTTEANQIDALVADLASVRDDELIEESQSTYARTLLRAIMESPLGARELAEPGAGLAPDSRSLGRRHRRTKRGRVRLVAVAAALVVAVVLSTAAFGVGQDIVSWLAGSNDVDGPVPTASDVVVATGEAGVPWRIVATPSDQGLCLFTVIAVSGEKGGSGNCGYTDIRGDLPRDLRGDPSAKCLATPTTVVPCGSLPRHWMSAPGGGGLQAGLERKFTYGLLAEGVASVELVLTDGESVRAHVVERPDGLPLNFYWATLTCPLQPAGGGLQECAENADGRDAGPEVEMAIARDVNGQVLERRVPVWNGNPTGDPDGPPPPGSPPPVAGA